MDSVIQAVYFSREPLSKSPHFHTCHQIILIVKGSVVFSVKGRTLRAGAGDLAIFSCYEDHSVAVSSAEYQRFVLQLDPNAIRREASVYSLLTNRPAGFSNVIGIASHQEALTDIFTQLIREYNDAPSLAEEMIRHLVSQLLIRVFRCTGLNTQALGDPVILSLKQQLERHFREKHTLDALASRYCISVSSLSHRFYATTGTSVMDYLLSCRMAQAKQLLANTDQSIGQIVDACGFSDNSNFSRAFKRLNGLSPSAFRKQYR